MLFSVAVVERGAGHPLRAGQPGRGGQRGRGRAARAALGTAIDGERVELTITKAADDRRRYGIALHAGAGQVDPAIDRQTGAGREEDPVVHASLAIEGHGDPPIACLDGDIGRRRGRIALAAATGGQRGRRQDCRHGRDCAQALEDCHRCLSGGYTGNRTGTAILVTKEEPALGGAGLAHWRPDR